MDNQSGQRVLRALVPDPLNPDSVRSVLLARGGPSMLTLADFEKLFAARARGELALVHETPNVTSPWTVYSDEPWFSALPRFEREYLSFAVRFVPGALETSKKPFFRLLMCAATIDGYLDLESDEQISHAWQYLLEVEQRIGVRLQDVPSLAELDPTLLLMTRHCVEVSAFFERHLTTEWAVDRIEGEIRGIASRGPVGRVLAMDLGERLESCRVFHSRLRVETVDYFRSLAMEACIRLARESSNLAYQGHPKRKPELTLKGLENAVFTSLANDFMDRRLSRREAVRLAREFLAQVVGEPYAGDKSSQFNRRNHIRWASKLSHTPH